MSKAKKAVGSGLKGITGSGPLSGLLGSGPAGGFIGKILGEAEEKKQAKSQGLQALQTDAEDTARGIERRMARRLSRAGRSGTVLSEGGKLG
ncbi:hypothetical protein [Litorivivens sp.]|uniref:hypothetical protein n=1 Tax=Litorivivens sp. TaxID=2020868 RepID=UPI0035677AE8